MLTLLLAADSISGWQLFVQQCLNGLTYGALIALIALGYTMVYGIIGLINFAHGDLFMLGTFLTLTLINAFGLDTAASAWTVAISVAALLIVVALFCAVLNFSVDRLIYKPLRNAPKLAPLVSAIGVSFIFQNVGLLWKGPADLSVPKLISQRNLLGDSAITFTPSDAVLLVVVAAIMSGLTVLVKFTRLGKSMRAVSQDPVAAQLMGIHVERVIGSTFLIGGGLAGFAAVIYSMYIGTIGFQIGYINGLYAFTAAVLGGIGNIPGAVLGGIVIGMVRSLGSAYVEERWTAAIIFGILIVILIFRPSGLLGERMREKV
ncbi:MAG TPA: branched-chain amino acid ABC transporter permease [Pirellulales bacterium]|jgi:branched-chain amino acid transport system permease protein|nr:branched-chain amino acid ABC transporter permease [Pirellulales bacterium]